MTTEKVFYDITFYIYIPYNYLYHRYNQLLQLIFYTSAYVLSVFIFTLLHLSKTLLKIMEISDKCINVKHK